MDTEIINNIAIFRITIGYLGERDQFGWWQSSFFTPGSSAFLSPTFSHTQLLAQCNGVTRAAALLHDERIGVGNVFHIFRLPEELEQGIHQALHKTQLRDHIQKIIASEVSALEYLRKNSTSQDHPSIGPTRIGNVHELRNRDTWKVVNGLYTVAFEKRIQILPYFTNQA